MAKKVTARTTGPKRSKPAAKKAPAKGRKSSSSRSASGGSSEGLGAADAIAKLLQSPLVADLVAVAATAALAALAEEGFNRGGDGKRTSKAVKAAGRAAAAAVGRRLTTEIEEIRKAAKDVRGGGKAKA